MPATSPIPLATAIPGQLITASLWNGEYANIYNLFTPTGLDDASSNDAAMQVQTDPYPSATISRPTSLQGELERIRYQLAQLGLTTYWYQDPLGAIAPTGSIIAFPTASAPTGWLLCDGTAVSRTTYANLFSLIGITHGQGDGSTTFNVPDYRGRFLRMVDGSAGRDPDKASRSAMATGGNTGNNVGSVQTDDYQSHTHNLSDPGHSHVISNQCNSSTGSGKVAVGGDAPEGSNPSTDSNTTGITMSASGGNETRPENAYVNYIIKT